MKSILRLTLAAALIAPGPFATDAAAQAYRAPRAVPTPISMQAMPPSVLAALPDSLSVLSLAPVPGLTPAAGLNTVAPVRDGLPLAAVATYSSRLASSARAPSPQGGEPTGPGGPNEPEWKQKTRAAWTKTRQVLRDTPAEVAVVGAFGLVVGLGLGWHHEAAREAAIPIGFSEIHQMEREAAAEGRDIGPTARYLAGANDMTMNVFNAWNIANERTLIGSPVNNFATELDYNAGQKLRIHKYELPHYFQSLPGEADAVRRLLEPYNQVRLQAAEANAHLSRTWSASHHDVTRTEWRTRTVTDGNGKSHTQIYTVQVYDHTNHSYVYDLSHGEASSASLDALTPKGQAASFTEDMRVAKKTNADGEYAAEKSRGLKQPLSAEEAGNISSTWKNGSTLMTNLPVIHARLGDLVRDSDQWRAEKNKAHNAHYPTRSHSDSGPREYQTAERALSHGRDLERSAYEVLEGIDYTRAMTPVLESKIKELIAVELEHKPGDAKALSAEVLTISKTIYTKNFKGGFNMDRFRAGVVALGALLGALSGGLLGWGADWLGKRRGWWGK